MTDKTPKPTQANRDVFADTSVLREALGVKGATCKHAWVGASSDRVVCSKCGKVERV